MAGQFPIEIKFKLPYKIRKRARYFVATCPILDVASQGPTEHTAKRNLLEALQLFLLSCLERGVLDQVLKECGFTGSAKLPKTDSASSLAAKKDYLTVPVHLLADKAHAHPCHG